jgi:hypothetical protein
MPRRREFLLGAGAAALGACAARRPEPAAPAASGAVPEGAADFDAPLDDFRIDIDNDLSK